MKGCATDMVLLYQFLVICLQAKADEIAKLMHENEQLKSVTEDLKVLESMRNMDLLDEGLIVSPVFQPSAFHLD